MIPTAAAIAIIALKVLATAMTAFFAGGFLVADWDYLREHKAIGWGLAIYAVPTAIIWGAIWS